MNTETLKLSGGYTATIATDTDAENPWTSWDCEPPIMVFSPDRFHGRLEDYKTGLSLKTVFDLLPLELFGDHGKILSALDLTVSDVADVNSWDDEYKPDDDDAKTWREAIRDCLPASPEYWGEAVEYFDAAESLCKMAGIACENTQSNGYSQGDSALVFSAALPEWTEKVGCGPDHVSAAVKGAAELWGAWAWGDVYGIMSIARPDGEEANDGSCWGFYGSDHKKSGLLEAAENFVSADIEYIAREEAESFRAACGDVATVD